MFLLCYFFVWGGTYLCLSGYAMDMSYSICIQRTNHKILFNIYLILFTLFLLPLIPPPQKKRCYISTQMYENYYYTKHLNTFTQCEKCLTHGGQAVLIKCLTWGIIKIVCVNIQVQNTRIPFFKRLFSLNIFPSILESLW